MTDNPTPATPENENTLADNNPLHSKRFWSMIVGAIVMLLATWFPELRTHADEIIPAILIIISLLVGGYSAEDAIRAYKSDNPPPTT